MAARIRGQLSMATIVPRGATGETGHVLQGRGRSCFHRRRKPYPVCCALQDVMNGGARGALATRVVLRTAARPPAVASGAGRHMRGRLVPMPKGSEPAALVRLLLRPASRSRRPAFWNRQSRFRCQPAFRCWPVSNRCRLTSSRRTLRLLPRLARHDAHRFAIVVRLRSR